MIPPDPTTMSQALTMHSLRAATLAARHRTGDPTIGTAVAGGRFRITRDITDAGKTRTEPISDWLDGHDLIPALNDLQLQPA